MGKTQKKKKSEQEKCNFIKLIYLCETDKYLAQVWPTLNSNSTFCLVSSWKFSLSLLIRFTLAKCKQKNNKFVALYSFTRKDQFDILAMWIFFSLLWKRAWKKRNKRKKKDLWLYYGNTNKTTKSNKYHVRYSKDI